MFAVTPALCMLLVSAPILRTLLHIHNSTGHRLVPTTSPLPSNHYQYSWVSHQPVPTNLFIRIPARQLATSNLLYESPRWLLRQDRRSEAAAIALKNLYGLQDDDQVAMEIEHILNAVSSTDDEDNYTIQEGKSMRPSDKQKTEISAFDLLADDVTRPMMITAIVLHVSQQVTCRACALLKHANSHHHST